MPIIAESFKKGNQKHQKAVSRHFNQPPKMKSKLSRGSSVTDITSLFNAQERRTYQDMMKHSPKVTDMRQNSFKTDKKYSHF